MRDDVLGALVVGPPAVVVDRLLVVVVDGLLLVVVGADGLLVVVDGLVVDADILCAVVATGTGPDVRTPRPR